MRDREQQARVTLGVRIRELEQASKEFVELLGKLDDGDPIITALKQNTEISAALDRCRETLRNKSEASKRWRDSLGKGAW